MLDSFANKNNIKIFKFNKNFFIYEFIKLILFRKISPDNNWLDVSFMYYCNIIKLFCSTVVVLILDITFALDR